FVFHTACKKSVFDRRPVKYVAYLGFNYTDVARDSANNYSDSLHIVALQTYLDRINACAGDEQYPAVFRLKTFQCNYVDTIIPQIYQNLIADTNIVLVVDNTWGKYIRHAAPLIRQGLPVIALSADQNKLDFGENAVFLGPSDPSPNFLVQFIHSVLKKKHIGFVTECDYLLHNRFVESIRNNNLQYDSVCLWQRSYIRNREVPSDSVASMKRMMRGLLNRPEMEVILMNTHAGYGDSIMRFLQHERLPAKIFVGIQTSLTDEELEKITRERGHTFIRLVSNENLLPIEVYRDKKVVKSRYANPFIPEEKKGEFKSDKKKEQERERERQANNTLRRCFDAANIFETALRAGADDRAEISAYFRGKLKNRKVSIFNELYEFDSLLILKSEPNFEKISRGNTRSNPIQINSEGEPIPDLRVGIDIVGISDVDVRKNTFDCNLLYWVIVDSNHLDKERYIDFPNISSEEGNRYDITQKPDSDYVVSIHRISGKFLGNFNSFDFPFDRHELIIPVSALAPSDKIKFSFDYSRLQVKNKINDFQLNDWDTEEYYVTLDNQITNAIGSPNKVTFDPNDKARFLEKYKTLNIHLKVSRQPWGAIILIVLPFLMFSALPIFMLFFHKASYEEVGELIITSFLATVAYSINLVQISPATDSMNLAYIFLMLTLGINFFCFIYVTYIDRQKANTGVKNNNKEKRRIFRFGSKIWITYLLIILLVMLFYLIFGN
ncbi:MAG: hypothetical protein IPJ82_15840, partial [Lewinellaceae bacterium]|nr:hypothetical protein [Lewinellaceae bacterium]